MEKLFNFLSTGIAIVGGITVKYLGGCDKLFMAMVSLVIIDYITGVIKAIYDKKLSSQVGYKGIIKKMMIFIVIATAGIVGQIIGDTIPLREITVMFFIANEGLSVLENISTVIPIPQRLKQVLVQIREKQDK